jgi:AcrR family transcriptional regulator
MSTPLVKRPMRADARRNYERLLTAAREVFAADGPEAPLEAVAERAGVGIGTLYRHFPDRDALLVAVYVSDLETLMDHARTLVDELPPGAALAAYLREHVAYINAQRGMLAAAKALMSTSNELSGYCRDILRVGVGEMVSAAQEEGTLRSDVTANDVLRLMHGVAMGTEQAPQDAERLLDIVLDGLRP